MDKIKMTRHQLNKFVVDYVLREAEKEKQDWIDNERVAGTPENEIDTGLYDLVLSKLDRIDLSDRWATLDVGYAYGELDDCFGEKFGDGFVAAITMFVEVVDENGNPIED